MIEKLLNALIGALNALIAAVVASINRVIYALARTIEFIVDIVSKMLRIIRLLIELLFYVLPFAEGIYIGYRLNILWLMIGSSAFAAIFAFQILRELFARNPSFGSDVPESRRRVIFAIFAVLNLVLGAIVGMLFLDIDINSIVRQIR
jgi:hypothetical protein